MTVRVTGKFAPVQIGRAITRKIPDTIQSAMSEMKKVLVEELSKEYFLSRRQITQAVKTKRAAKTTKYHNAYLKITGKRLSLDEYKLSPMRKGKRPLRLMGAVKRGPLKPLGPAFLYAPHGKLKPFMRKGKARLPIQKLIAPAIPQLVEHNEELQQQAIEVGKRIILRKLRELKIR